MKEQWNEICQTGYRVTVNVEHVDAIEVGDCGEVEFESETDTVCDGSEEETLEDVVLLVEDHCWLHWSCSDPETQSDPALAQKTPCYPVWSYGGYVPWLIAEGESHFTSSVTDYYTCHIERCDGYPLSPTEYGYLRRSLDLINC